MKILPAIVLMLAIIIATGLIVIRRRVNREPPVLGTTTESRVSAIELDEPEPEPDIRNSDSSNSTEWINFNADFFTLKRPDDIEVKVENRDTYVFVKENGDSDAMDVILAISRGRLPNRSLEEFVNEQKQAQEGLATIAGAIDPRPTTLAGVNGYEITVKGVSNTENKTLIFLSRDGRNYFSITKGLTDSKGKSIEEIANKMLATLDFNI